MQDAAAGDRLRARPRGRPPGGPHPRAGGPPRLARRRALRRRRLVLCAGEAGIGKTRLAQELSGAALAGGARWPGGAASRPRAPPFWPWRQVLRTVGLDPDAVLDHAAESAEDRFGLFAALVDALAGAADGLLVIVDDLHWGDELSLLALRHVAAGLGETRVLLLATYRDDEAGGPLPRVLPDLLRAPRADGWTCVVSVCRRYTSSSNDHASPEQSDTLPDLVLRDVGRPCVSGSSHGRGEGALDGHTHELGTPGRFLAEKARQGRALRPSSAVVLPGAASAVAGAGPGGRQ